MTTAERPAGPSPSVVALVFSPNPSGHTAAAASAVLNGVETKGGATTIQHVHNPKIASCSFDGVVFDQRVNPTLQRREGQAQTYGTSRLVDVDS